MSRKNKNPYVDPLLIELLEQTREWQDIAPEPDWDAARIQRNIGAVQVIRRLKQLLKSQYERDLE